MKTTNILAFIFGLILATRTTIGAPQREKRQIESIEIEDFGDDVSEIRKFHVNSKIQLRYAITDIETRMQNR